MRKISILLFSILLGVSSAYAYVEKIYNECGEKVGSVRKVGEEIIFYNNSNQEVEDYDSLFEPSEDDGKVRFVVGTYPRRYKNPFNKNFNSECCNKNIYYIPKGGYRFIPKKYYVGL